MLEKNFKFAYLMFLLLTPIASSNILHHKAEVFAQDLSNFNPRCHIHFMTDSTLTNPYFEQPVSVSFCTKCSTHEKLKAINVGNIKGINCILSVAVFAKLRITYFSMFPELSAPYRNLKQLLNEARADPPVHPVFNKYFIYIFLHTPKLSTSDMASLFFYSIVDGRSRKVDVPGGLVFLPTMESFVFNHRAFPPSLVKVGQSELLTVKEIKATFGKVAEARTYYWPNPKSMSKSLSDLFPPFNQTIPGWYLHPPIALFELNVEDLTRVKIPGEVPTSLLYVPIGSTGFSYITCYSKQNRGFIPYTFPIHWTIGLATGLSMLAVIAILFLNLPVRQKHAIPFYVIAALLKTKFPLFGKQSKRSTYRLSLGIWLITTSIFLTTAYLAALIHKVGAPILSFPAFQRFEDVNRLSCNDSCKCVPRQEKKYDRQSCLSAPEIAGRIKLLDDPINLEATQGGSFSPGNSKLLSLFRFGEAVENRLQHVLEEIGIDVGMDPLPKQCPEFPERFHQALNSKLKFDNYVDLIPKTYGIGKGKTRSFQNAIEAELVECSKTIYILVNEKLLFEQRYLSQMYSNLTFFTGAIGNEGVAVLGIQEASENLKDRVSRYVAAGLIKFLHSLQTKKGYRRRYKEFTRNNSAPFRFTVKPMKISNQLDSLILV